MALIHSLGLDVLKANTEARQAHADLRTNVNKLGLVKGEDKGKKPRKGKKVTEAPAPEVVEKPDEDEAPAKETPVTDEPMKTKGE